MLYLFCYDEVLGTADSDRIGRLVHESFLRATWLMESLGQVAGRENDLLEGIRVIVEAFERAETSLELNRQEFVGVLFRVETDRDQIPVIRGAAVGALWRLGEASADQVLSDMLFFSDPSHLGDFLTGLFCLAREVAQRQPKLVRAIDDTLMSFSGDDLIHALPSLRLAFTYFTPREKHHMLMTLFGALEIKDTKPLPALEVDAETAAEALAFEDRLYQAVEQYGLRGNAE